MPFLVTERIFAALVEAGVVKEEPGRVRRVVIDLQAGHAGLVYVETFPDEERLRVALDAGLEVVGGER